MPIRKLTLEAVNERLKAGKIGVSVLQRGERLYNTALGETCADWVARYRLHLEANVFKDDPDDQWRKDYWNAALKWLPQERPLDADRRIGLMEKSIVSAGQQ
jgi:hypothetical protein